MKLRLKQKCNYYPAVSDGWGGYTQGEPIEIPCRWVNRQRLIRSKTGEEKMSKSEIHAEYPVETTGFLSQDGTPQDIMAVDTLVDLNGKIVGYKAWL